MSKNKGGEGRGTSKGRSAQEMIDAQRAKKRRKRHFPNVKGNSPEALMLKARIEAERARDARLRGDHRRGFTAVIPKTWENDPDFCPDLNSQPQWHEAPVMSHQQMELEADIMTETSNKWKKVWVNRDNPDQWLLFGVTYDHDRTQRPVLLGRSPLKTSGEATATIGDLLKVRH